MSMKLSIKSNHGNAGQCTVFPKGNSIMTARLTTHLKPARVAARGRKLLGVCLSTFGVLAIVLGISHTILLLELAAFLVVLFWFLARFPVAGWSVMGFIDGLI